LRLLRIQRNWEPWVDQFCQACAKLNYMNNASLEAMKWDWEEVIWYGHYTDRFVSLSGIHPFANGYRVCFRGATLPGISNFILNKYQAIQGMKDLGENNYYVTTNVDADGTDGPRLSHALKKGKIWKANLVAIEDVFNVKQEIWKLENIYIN
jgi:hypothetical protein